jgi:aspartyl-tRNA(Asn)/glutamyl-tRNA(Gln) amidotransferase subunit A
LNAFITVLPEASMDKAKAAEVEIRKGDWKSALHGVPIAVKDFYDTAGISTTAAFEHFRTRVVRRQNFVVREMNGLRGEGDGQTPRPPRRVKTG